MSRGAKAATTANYALLSILQKKCEEYWPLNVDESIHPGHGINVTLTSMLPFAEYSVRKMTATCVSYYDTCITKLE